MKDINIAVIGLGRLGYCHAQNICRSSGAKLAAVSDPISELVTRVSAKFGVKGYTEYNEMINDPDIDAIVVATPTRTHFKILLDVIKTKKPILCEKPITYSVEEATQIVDLVEKHNIFMMIAYMRRFDPAYQEAKVLLKSGEAGNPIFLFDCSRDAWAPPKSYVPQSGGLFVDMSIHDLDISRWLMGSEIVEITAQGAILKNEWMKEYNDIDDGQMLLKFANGALGMINVSRNGNGVYDVRTEVLCTNKIIRIEQAPKVNISVIGKKEYIQPMNDGFMERYSQAYENEMQAFIDCIREKKPSPSTPYDGLVGIKLALAATESYQTKRTVVLSY